MKAALVLLALVAVASAAPQPRKRAWIGDVVNSIGNFFQDTYNSALNAVRGLISRTDFDRIVDVLVDQIDSSYTNAGCSMACEAGAATILGPFAALAGSVCGPACEVALAQLEQAAG